MRVNMEYVKEKVKQQLKNLAAKNRTKHNNNKHKTTMKSQSDIRFEL